MSENSGIGGLDVYVGAGADMETLKRVLTSAFGVAAEAIVDYDSPSASGAPLFGRWVFLHRMAPGRRFAFKLDIEIHAPFDWPHALTVMAKTLGVRISFPDETHPADEMICIHPDGSREQRAFDPEDYDTE